MIVASSGRISAASGHDHDTGAGLSRLAAMIPATRSSLVSTRPPPSFTWTAWPPRVPRDGTRGATEPVRQRRRGPGL